MRLSPTQALLLEESLHELGLPVRIINALETGANVFTVKELLRLTPEQVLALPNFGQKTLNTIHEALAKFGFITKNNPLVTGSTTSADLAVRRRNIRDALGGSAVDDWDAEILLYGNARARKRQARPKAAISKAKKPKRKSKGTK